MASDSRKKTVRKKSPNRKGTATSKAATSARSLSEDSERLSVPVRVAEWFREISYITRARVAALKARRPHRSFVRTRRRDYARSWKMPGYIAFTVYVAKTLFRHRKVFGWQVLVYTLLMIAVGVLTTQHSYAQATELLSEVGGEIIEGTWGKVGETALIMVGAFSGWPSQLTTDQQIYLGIASVMIWLTTVWLLREMMAGRRTKFRDGLYSSGAPIMPSLILVFILLLQMIPAGIMALVYNGLKSVGLLSDGFSNMLVGVTAAVVVSLVLYWTVSTFIALIVVTLPGVYPLQALRAAGDLVVGRRLRIMYRMVWSAIVTAVAWVVIMVPIMLADGALKSTWSWLESVPFIPVAVALMSALTVTWWAAYIYLMYRKIVADDAKPA